MYVQNCCMQPGTLPYTYGPGNHDSFACFCTNVPRYGNQVFQVLGQPSYNEWSSYRACLPGLLSERLGELSLICFPSARCGGPIRSSSTGDPSKQTQGGASRWTDRPATAYVRRVELCSAVRGGRREGDGNRRTAAAAAAFIWRNRQASTLHLMRLSHSRRMEVQPLSERSHSLSILSLLPA